MECIVCNNSDKFNIYLKAKRHHPNYWKCNECGFIFAYPIIQDNFRNYDILIPDEFSYNMRLKNYEIRYDIIKQYLKKPNNKIIDIGSNIGIFIRLLENKKLYSIGIEPNVKAVEYGLEKFNVNLIPVSFEDYITDEKFDCITMFNVFEHLKDPVAALKKSKKLLTKNGILVFEIPNIFTLQSFISFGYWHHFSLTHYWFFNKNTIKRFLVKHGFEPVQIAFVPKVATYAKIFDGLMTATLAVHLAKNSYKKIRKTSFYHFLNKIEAKVNLKDYLFVISRYDKK